MSKIKASSIIQFAVITIGIICVCLSAYFLTGCLINSNYAGDNKGTDVSVSNTSGSSPSSDANIATSAVSGNISSTSTSSLATGTAAVVTANGAATVTANGTAAGKQAGSSTVNEVTRSENFVEPKFVPVLMYHAVNDDTFGISELFVKPNDFRKQMQYLKDNGYTPIDFSELPNFKKYSKPVIITMDDGYDDNYTYAYPILKEMGFRATIFVCSGFVGSNKYLSKEHIQSMTDIISFQNHTVLHEELDKLSESKIEEIYKKSNADLLEITGSEPYAIAYPVGKYSAAALKVTKKYFEFGIGTTAGVYSEKSDNYKINRFYIPRSTSMDTFIKKLKNQYKPK